MIGFMIIGGIVGFIFSGGNVLIAIGGVIMGSVIRKAIAEGLWK